MRTRRSWLGLLAAILTVVVLWWVQGDGGTATQDPQASPTTAEPTAEPTGTLSDVPSLPTPTQTATDSPLPTSGTDPDSGLPIVAVEDLPPEAHETIALIDQGGPFPYPQDGDTFRNDEGLLPDQPTGEQQGLSLVDVGPTIMQLYGGTVPEGAVGRSFL